MSVRRKTDRRLTLVRECGVCGRTFTTTASSPWIRLIPRGGKKQATTYFCSESCFAKSYKHIGWYDGKAEQRRTERERKRDHRARSKRYYAAHADEICEKHRAKYWADVDAARLTNKFNREKRKLLMVENSNKIESRMEI